jgi:hypothetical protein
MIFTSRKKWITCFKKKCAHSPAADAWSCADERDDDEDRDAVAVRAFYFDRSVSREEQRERIVAELGDDVTFSEK